MALPPRMGGYCSRRDARQTCAPRTHPFRPNDRHPLLFPALWAISSRSGGRCSQLGRAGSIGNSTLECDRRDIRDLPSRRSFVSNRTGPTDSRTRRLNVRHDSIWKEKILVARDEGPPLVAHRCSSSMLVDPVCPSGRTRGLRNRWVQLYPVESIDPQIG